MMLSKVEPKTVCIVEAEFWPNLVNLIQKKGINLILINGRISSKSLPTYKKLNILYKYTLRKFNLICAQSQESYDNFLELGVYKSNLSLTRNTKFDLALDNDDLVAGKALSEKFVLDTKRVLLGASTHMPEEQILISCFASLRTKYTDVKLILVPRHPHRFEEVFELARASGFKVEKYSQERPVNEEADILIIDAMGLLKACYSICEIGIYWR